MIAVGARWWKIACRPSSWAQLVTWPCPFLRSFKPQSSAMTQQQALSSVILPDSSLPRYWPKVSRRAHPVFISSGQWRTCRWWCWPFPLKVYWSYLGRWGCGWPCHRDGWWSTRCAAGAAKAPARTHNEQMAVGTAVQWSSRRRTAWVRTVFWAGMLPIGQLRGLLILLSKVKAWNFPRLFDRANSIVSIKSAR